MSGRHSRSRKRSRSPREYRHSTRDNCDSSRKRRRRRYNSNRDRSESGRQALDAILGRLNAIEDKLSISLPIAQSRPARECQTPPPVTAGKADITGESNSDFNTSSNIMSVLTSLMQAKPSHYYISNFDPSVHDFDVWCAEVNCGRELNRWDDRECLSRIGGCLKDDARTLLNDWVCSDRSWTNFKTDFRALCPRNVDVANILYDIMSTGSNNFVSYAEYARKSLLRLDIVKGLSDDLKTAIVIRGIADPQVKAAASNAKLQPKAIVEFLSVYAKPKADFQITRSFPRHGNINRFDSRKSEVHKPVIKCFNCGNSGHTKAQCFKKPKSNAVNTDKVSNKAHAPRTYCSKPGHSVDKCFTKQRVESKSNEVGKVNF
jgi:hypothetical protein